MMSSTFGRRFAAVAVLTAGGVAAATGSASASSYGPYALPYTGHGLGVYSQPYVTASKPYFDLPPGSGDGIQPVCWTTGDDIANQGDVWHRTDAVLSDVQVGAQWYRGTFYVYARYGDNDWLFYNDQIPQCP